MIGITILAVTIVACAIFGTLVMLRLAASRDDHNGRLPGMPPTLAAAASRRLTGLWVNIPQASARTAAMQQRWNGRRDELF